MEILSKIITRKQEELNQVRSILDFDMLMEKASNTDEVRTLPALSSSRPLIIGEFKRFSPSRPGLAVDKDPVDVATAYEQSGFGAVSVLTDHHFFGARPDDLGRVKKATALPILRKEFIIDPLQIPESKIMGADLILLISRVLSKPQLKRFYSIAKELGLQVLIETENESEFEFALELNPDLVGINNRDLSTLTIDLKKTERILQKFPCDVPVIAESGIHSVKEANHLLDFGVSGFLIGEYLLSKGSVEEAARDFVQSLKKEETC